MNNAPVSGSVKPAEDGTQNEQLIFLIRKDLRLAKGQGLNFPLSEPLLNTFRQAQQEGLGEEDCMAII